MIEINNCAILLMIYVKCQLVLLTLVIVVS